MCDARRSRESRSEAHHLEITRASCGHWRKESADRYFNAPRICMTRVSVLRCLTHDGAPTDTSGVWLDDCSSFVPSYRLWNSWKRSVLLACLPPIRNHSLLSIHRSDCRTPPLYVRCLDVPGNGIGEQSAVVATVPCMRRVRMSCHCRMCCRCSASCVGCGRSSLVHVSSLPVSH